MISERQLIPPKSLSQQATEKALLEEAYQGSLRISANKSYGRLSVFKGLLWAEWYAHSKLLLSFLVLWLACVWVLPAFAHPGWILLIGIVYAFLAGPLYGGGDVIEGCEEFTFSLPATRSERYWARLTVGGGALLLFTALDLLSLGLDLSPALARLYIRTGLIQPLPVLKSGWLYGLVLAVPFAVFSFSFSLSAVAHSRFLIFTAWLWGGLCALGILYLGLLYEDGAWNEMNGFFSCPFLIILGSSVLWIGHRLYRQKEIGAYTAPITLPNGWWLWGILLILGFALALLLISALAKQYPRFLAAAA
jgi:hypothetical protein